MVLCVMARNVVLDAPFGPGVSKTGAVDVSLTRERIRGSSLYLPRRWSCDALLSAAYTAFYISDDREVLEMVARIVGFPFVQGIACYKSAERFLSR